MGGGHKPNIDASKIALLQRLAETQVPNRCQRWPGTVDARGYGRIWLGGRWRLAHHAMYEVVKGKKLAVGLTLDHYRMNDKRTCYKDCVNLFHLEPVTNVENVMRGNGACARHARKTKCKRGHPFTVENTYLKPGGGRECRACDRLNYLRRRTQILRQRREAYRERNQRKS